MREVVPATIAVSAPSGTPVLLLREVGADRYLPIWIGLPEAQAIALAARGAKTERPPTHALISAVIEAFGQRLREIVITDLRDGIFHAELVFDSGMRVSARPSDAVALALRAGASIQAEDDLLDQLTLSADQLGVPQDDDVADGENTEDPEAEVERLRAFLDHADPEDFGRYGPSNSD